MAVNDESEQELAFAYDVVSFVWFQSTSSTPYSRHWSLPGLYTQISSMTENHLTFLVYDTIVELHAINESMFNIGHLTPVFMHTINRFTEDQYIPGVRETFGNPPVLNPHVFLLNLFTYCFKISYWAFEIYLLGNQGGAVLAITRIYQTLKELKSNGYIDHRTWEVFPEWTFNEDNFDIN